MGHTSGRIPVLALWSAPRSRSTAFARMMAERDDRVAVHEPFSRVVDFGEVEVGGRVARSEQDVLAALRAIATRHALNPGPRRSPQTRCCGPTAPTTCRTTGSWGLRH